MTQFPSIKVSAEQSSVGRMGQQHLAASDNMSMRLWKDEPPNRSKPETWRDYETIGYVIEGRAKLRLQDQEILLEPGDSWVVPKGARHNYSILETFTAVEATHPPTAVPHPH